ncbi:HNH endonuclease family protein [Nonomuraea sp. NPDC049655]|uniref:HNH endonuclease family protein n=1 Tax=Nonomuraea sp. NPDC049655 TaxID=3364355 RepID=UPI0037B6FA6B
MAAAILLATSMVVAAAPAATAATAQTHRLGPLLADAVAELPVADERREGYQRTAFRHWIDADRDGCNTRAEVLLEEAIEPPAVGERCSLTGGSWYSYYDDQTVNVASGLDVDHLVPLAEAWDSGAYDWTSDQRRDYANDLDESWHLVAVTARSNRSKADQDPATWQPPYEPARCRYAAEWTAVKMRWSLSIDTAEQQALTALGEACPDQRLPEVGDQM